MCRLYLAEGPSPSGERAINPEHCLGKKVFTPEGECLGEVLDVSLYSFSRVKQILVETEKGVRNIDWDLVSRIEPDRILLRRWEAVNEW